MANANKKVTASKKNKQYNPMKKFFSVFMLMMACFFTYMSAKEIITTMQLKQEIRETREEMQALEEQQAILEDQKQKFSDEEYVKRYARGKYLMSKEGETLYKLNEPSAETDSEEEPETEENTEEQQSEDSEE